MRERRSTGYNTGFASGGVTCKLGALCFYSSSVQVDSFVLRYPPERKARKRYPQFDQTTAPREIMKTSSLKSCEPCFVGFPIVIPLHSVMIV